MRVATESPVLPRSVVSIGMFDGVHKGHREVLRQLRAQGRLYRAPTVVVTFDPHPRAIVADGSAPSMLNTLGERLSLLQQTGCVDHCVVLPFDDVMRRRTAEEFVSKLLVAKLGMRSLVVGQDFSCGQGRRGDVAALRALGCDLGYSVAATNLVPAPADPSAGSVRCSSTQVRRLVEAGDVKSAAAVLQRPYQLSGTVAAAGPGLLRVAVPRGLCAPTPGAYWGAARRCTEPGTWRPAIVSPDPRPGAEGHMLVASTPGDGDAPWRSGEAMLLRFLDRVAVGAAL